MTKEEFAQMLSSKADYAKQLEMIIANAKDSGLLVVYDLPSLEEAREWLNGIKKSYSATLKWNDDRDCLRIETDLPHATFTLKDFNGQPCVESVVLDTKDLQ